MNDLLLDGILLAQQSPLENLAREFQGRETRLESGYLLTGLAILLAILMAVWLLSRILDRFDGRRPVDSSRMLFLSLCKAHGLRWSEWWLLFRLTKEQKLDEPARVFLEPEWLEPANWPVVLQSRSKQLEELRGRLFAGLPQGDLQSPQSTDHDAEPKAPAAAEPRLSPVPAVSRGLSDDSVEGPPPLPLENPPPATFA